jgi:hypothetical protein
LKTHMAKLWLCFDKCHEFGTSFNPKKCMFLAFSNVIFNYIISKEGKLLNLKKSATIINMPKPKTPKDIQRFNGMAQFYHSFIQTLFSSWPRLANCCEKPKFFNGLSNVNKCGRQSNNNMWMHQSWLHQGGIWNFTSTLMCPI